MPDLAHVVVEIYGAHERSGVECVKVESDMGYHRDPLAHLLSKVFPNHVSRGKADPLHTIVAATD